MAAAVGAVLFGGVRRIGAAAERLVPAVSAGYILLCLWVLVRCRQRILPAFAAIVTGAFSPRAVTGGLIGSAFVSLRTGCARGIFTNEAGMGTASMAYAAAQDADPAELGLLGLIEVFADTIVICSLTALAVLTSGIAIPYGVDAGGVLPFQVFSTVCGADIFSVRFRLCYGAGLGTLWGALRPIPVWPRLLEEICVDADGRGPSGGGAANPNPLACGRDRQRPYGSAQSDCPYRAEPGPGPAGPGIQKEIIKRM